jgi:dTDP-glucose 4,6-dehydratase
MEDLILVTGGAGFIGSNFCLDWLSVEHSAVVNLDSLTYAGNLGNLSSVLGNVQHKFVHGSINDGPLLRRLFADHAPRAVVHFAAESHVDRSITGPQAFIATNVNGTFELLAAAREYWEGLTGCDREDFRFLHVSTDEVYGSLDADAPAFTEDSPYRPNSPYAASKAASDHLVRAYHHTYGLPTLITNCSNNYGPFQFPEKLIPLMISNALAGKPLPVYGDGMNVRDWLYVADHCDAIRTVLRAGRPGQTYNIGGNAERNNLEVVRLLCASLDEAVPAPDGQKYGSLVKFVKDRPGHDRRYAINATKMADELGWRATETFESGLHKTVAWYLGNAGWIEQVCSGAYLQWIDRNYGERGAACEG